MESLLAMLGPLWRGVIGCCVALAVAVATTRLVRRGRSRMNTALLITAGSIVTVVALGALLTR